MGRLDVEGEFEFYNKKYPYEKSSLCGMLEGKDFNDILKDREKVRKKELIKFERLELAYRDKIESLELEVIYNEKEAKESSKELKKVLKAVIEILDSIDDFKETLDNIGDERINKSFKRVSKLVDRRINYIGLEKIKTVMEQFNEDFHYCVEVVESENYDNEVITEEVKSGYKYKGEVIRESKVVVAKNEGSV